MIMRNILLLALFSSFFIVNGQEFEDFKKGRNYFVAGYGALSINPLKRNGGIAGGRYGNVYNNIVGAQVQKSTIGPFQLVYERGITDVLGVGRIGVGATLTHAFYSYKITDSYWATIYNNDNVSESKKTRIGIMGRGAYHFEFNVPKLDFYTGIGLGVYIDSDKLKEYDYNVYNNITGQYDDVVIETEASSVNPAFAIFAGVRYYVKNRLGFYVELGYGPSIMNGGVVLAL